MPEQIQSLLTEFMSSPETMMIAGMAVGALMLFVGVASIIRERNPAAARIATMSNRATARQERGLLKAAELDPRGMMRHFVPTNEKDRSALQAKLLRAGISNPNAVQNFTMFRIVFGLLLPGILVFLLFASKVPDFPIPSLVADRLSSLSNLQIFQVITILVAIGYYAPSYWLNARIKERTLQIEEGFPNAMDLMQVSLEAGLGFDAAMTRVGNELASVSPNVATEFLTVQRQIQAGRSRDQAMNDMAERTGVDTVRSFASVIQQSVQFGTPMNEALMAYAKEMRMYREMKATEMANKLPVKMSAVLASFMLPALVLLVLGPTVIRYMELY